MYMEYMKNLNNKDANVDYIKEMYTCGRDTSNVSQITNTIGLILIVVVVFFVVYRFTNRPNIMTIDKFISFTDNQEIFKLFVSLLILANIKILTNSVVANIILPLIKPILPLLTCNLNFKVGLFEMYIGNFLSDLIVFLANLYVIYFMFSIVY